MLLKLINGINVYSKFKLFFIKLEDFVLKYYMQNNSSKLSIKKKIGHQNLKWMV